MRGEFGIETSPMVKSSQIVNYSCGKCQSGGFSGRKPPPRGPRSKSECAALTSSFDMDNSDGKASLKQQKSLETSTDTQGMSKFLLILRVKYSYFEIFVVKNRPYFVPHTIPYNVFKFSTVPLVTQPHFTQRMVLS